MKTKMEALEEMLNLHPAIHGELESGFLKKVKEHHHTTMPELEAAVSMLCEYPKTWTSPTGMLMSFNCWKNGKWDVKPRQDEWKRIPKQKLEKEDYPDHPLWARAEQWFFALPEAQRRAILQAIGAQLDWIRQEYWKNDILNKKSPGRAYLIAMYENTIDPQLAEFRRTYQHPGHDQNGSSSSIGEDEEQDSAGRMHIPVVEHLIGAVAGEGGKDGIFREWN